MKYLGHNFEQSLLYLSHPTLGCSGPKLVTFYKKYVLFTGWAVYLEEVLNGKDWKEREEDLSIQKKISFPYLSKGIRQSLPYVKVRACSQPY